MHKSKKIVQFFKTCYALYLLSFANQTTKVLLLVVIDFYKMAKNLYSPFISFSFKCLQLGL